MSDSVQTVQEKIKDAISAMFGKPNEAVLTLEDVHEMSQNLLVRLGFGERNSSNYINAGVLDYTITTVKFWRRSGLISAPEGQTANARYSVNHVYEAALARLTGAFSLRSLAELAEQIRTVAVSERINQLADAVVSAEVVLKARREASTASTAMSFGISSIDATAIASTLLSSAGQATIRSAISDIQKPAQDMSVKIDIGAGVQLIIPPTHPALKKNDPNVRLLAIRALVRAVDDALIKVEPTWGPRPLPKRP